MMKVNKLKLLSMLFVIGIGILNSAQSAEDIHLQSLENTAHRARDRWEQAPSDATSDACHKAEGAVSEYQHTKENEKRLSRMRRNPQLEGKLEALEERLLGDNPSQVDVGDVSQFTIEHPEQVLEQFGGTRRETVSDISSEIPFAAYAIGANLVIGLGMLCCVSCCKPEQAPQWIQDIYTKHGRPLQPTDTYFPNLPSRNGYGISY